MNARVTPIMNEAETALMAAFDAARPLLAGAEAVAHRRDEAFATFTRSGLPNRRMEAWHYTDLRAALREMLPLAEIPSAAVIDAARLSLEAKAPRIVGTEAVRFVLLDGVYIPDLSDSAIVPAGVVVRSLIDVLAQDFLANPIAEADLSALVPDEAFSNGDSALALNAAFMNGGLVIDVAEGARIDRPFEIVSITSEGQAHSFFSRSLVRVGKGGALTLIETHLGAEGFAVQQNDALILEAGNDAEIEHVATFPSAAAESIHVSTLAATLGERAKLKSFALVEGAGLLRRQGFVQLAGVEAKASLAGVSLLRARQHADTTLLVRHVAPHCESREFFRHILDDEAIGVFQGKVVVAPGAQKTDGEMKSQAVLLSESARMNNKPELEIFADDVVCGHGATSGELDPEQIFYVQSRGLPRPEAEALLLEAFAAAAVDHVESAPLRSVMLDEIQTWLAERRL